MADFIARARFGENGRLDAVNAVDDTASGNTVTVTRAATGSAQIIINTEDGNFVAVHTVTVS